MRPTFIGGGAALPDIGPYTTLGRDAGTGQPVALARHPRRYYWWGTAAPANAAARYVATVGSPAYTANATDSAPFLVGTACTGVAFSWVGNLLTLANDAVACTIVRAPAGSTTFADTALTFTIPAGTVAGTLVQDIAHTVAFAAGDRVALKCLQSGVTAQAAWYSSWELLCL